MPVLFYFLTLKPYNMIKLELGQKKHIMSKFFELLHENGYSLNEYIFLPASKINFKNVLMLIDELEKEAGYETDFKFLFNNPVYENFLKQK